MESKDLIKDILSNDKDKLIYVLEELGCHKINPNFSDKEIRCALPDGDTGTSVSVNFDEFLGCMVFSRSDYEDYATKDIITLVQFINKMSFGRAIGWLCECLNIQQEQYERNNTNIQLATELRKLKYKKTKQFTNVQHEILSLDVLNKYKQYIVEEWVNEGITEDIQKKYMIHIDEYRKRWLIPIFDDKCNLISIKGRSYLPNIKEMDIPKYWYYYRLGVNDILFGLNFNKQIIKQRNEIILFEGEKSVMKADSFGYNWCASVGKCGINPHIKRKILELKCDVIIAFDKDINFKSVYKEAKKISEFTNVFAIVDNCNLLDLTNKDAPVDKGKEIFDRLYNSKIRIK